MLLLQVCQLLRSFCQLPLQLGHLHLAVLLAHGLAPGKGNHHILGALLLQDTCTMLMSAQSRFC